jgi:toxin ParE1/3/4
VRIRWSGEANRDLNAIFDYLTDRSPRRQLSLSARLRSRIGQLARHPLIAPVVAAPDVRMLVITRTNFLIYYRVLGEEIVVLRVRHGAQEVLDFSKG